MLASGSLLRRRRPGQVLEPGGCTAFRSDSKRNLLTYPARGQAAEEGTKGFFKGLGAGVCRAQLLGSGMPDATSHSPTHASTLPQPLPLLRRRRDRTTAATAAALLPPAARPRLTLVFLCRCEGARGCGAVCGWGWRGRLPGAVAQQQPRSTHSTKEMKCR